MLRNRSLLTTILAFATTLGICLLRALPAFERGTYATEGGEWLCRMWQTGFWKMIFGARGDYAVLGNMVVIKVSDLLANLLGGHSLAACGPAIQHVSACVYVALIFTFIFAVLRTHHGWWRAALITLVMLLAPDLDGENRVFGEANNVGFFNALGIVFLYYDVWLRAHLSKPRTIVYAFLIVFHLLTSPLAGLIAAGFCALLIGRSLWAWKTKSEPLPKIVWLHVATILLAAWVITLAKPESADPMSERAAHTAAVVLPRFWKTFIELALCRQLLYPLTLNVYESFTDGRTLVLLGIVIALLARWIVIERRRANGAPEWSRLSLMLLLFGIAFCMSVVTIWSRGWLTQSEQPYTKLWPARYYLVQTMLSAGFIAMVLLRVGDLYPRFRRDAIALVLILAASFALPQSAVIREALHHYDPHVPAKRWEQQLAHVRDLHALPNGGTLPAQSGLFYDVEMYIEQHFVNVPAPMLAEFFAKQNPPHQDVCEIAMIDVSKLKPDARRTFSLAVQELRVIPRTSGTLISFEAMLDDSAHFDVKRRKLWLGAMQGASKVQASVYKERKPRVQEHSRKRLSDYERLLFKVQVWFDQPLTLAQARQRLSGLPIALGPTAGEYLARGTVLPSIAEVPVSALPDDVRLANVQQPLSEAWHWAWKSSELSVTNVTADKRGIALVDDAPFDEAAYLRSNPDVAAAVEAKAIASGKAHFDHWGKNEDRQSSLYAVSLDTGKANLTTDKLAGIRIEVSRRKDRPERLRCILQGPAGEQSAFVLVPSEGTGVFEAYQFTPEFLAASHAITKLEIQLEHPQPGREFHIEDIYLYQRHP